MASLFRYVLEIFFQSAFQHYKDYKVLLLPQFLLPETWELPLTSFLIIGIRLENGRSEESLVSSISIYLPDSFIMNCRSTHITVLLNVIQWLLTIKPKFKNDTKALHDPGPAYLCTPKIPRSSHFTSNFSQDPWVLTIPLHTLWLCVEDFCELPHLQPSLISSPSSKIKVNLEVILSKKSFLTSFTCSLPYWYWEC